MVYTRHTKFNVGSVGVQVLHNLNLAIFERSFKLYKLLMTYSSGVNTIAKLKLEVAHRILRCSAIRQFFADCDISAFVAS